MFVHFQEAAFVCLQTHRFDVERTCRAGPPDAVERHLGDDLFAAGEMDLYTVAVFVGDGFDHIHLFAEAHNGALLVEMIGERVDDFRVHEWEQAAALVNDRDTHAEGSKDAGIFKTDHARAHHRQRARQMIELEQIVADEDPLSVKRDAVAFRGAGACSDDNVRGADVAPAASIHIFQTDCVGIHKRGFSRDKFDAVALELMADDIEFMLDDVVSAIQQICHRDVLLDGIRCAVEAVLTIPGKMQYRFAQGFAGDGACVDAHAADDRLAFDDCHALVEFCRLDRGALTGRS